MSIKRLYGFICAICIGLSLFFIFFHFFSPTPSRQIPGQIQKHPEIQIIEDSDYFPVVNKALKEATQSVKVMMFEVGYYPEYPDSPSNILVEDLIKAKKRGVKVRVILEVSDWNPKVTKKNRYVGELLSRGGVEVSYDSLQTTTHTKLVIIDSQLSIFGSTNWTYYSLTHNRELSIIIKSPEIAKELEEYFNKAWGNKR